MDRVIDSSKNDKGKDSYLDCVNYRLKDSNNDITQQLKTLNCKR